VMPGEEVDVDVEMTAPSSLGRYLGYWRLMGPRGRKFGQRVWCHIQVVDPSAPEEAHVSGVEIDKAAAEIAKKKSALASAEEDHVEAAEDDMDAGAPIHNAPTMENASGKEASASLASASPDMRNEEAGTVEAPKGTEAMEILPVVDSEGVVTDAMSDVSDSVLVTEGMAMEDLNAEPQFASQPVSAANSVKSMPSSVGSVVSTASSAPAAMNYKNASAADPSSVVASDPSSPEAIKLALTEMGFEDATMIETAIHKNGPDLEACARDLAAATEWDNLLEDLAEMGFANRELNKSLMLQHNGNLKRTVKALVEDA